MGEKEKTKGSERKNERQQEELSSGDLVIFINKLSLLFFNFRSRVVSYTFSLLSLPFVSVNFWFSL